ncbi:MAG: hypothetical protein LBQ11_02865 [Candidatus Nomurabacteria bacterium]|jgi:hypothetical protein|nr:hypothetical protein [Candidatus Nomurabacteria bacterium]
MAPDTDFYTAQARRGNVGYYFEGIPSSVGKALGEYYKSISTANYLDRVECAQRCSKIAEDFYPAEARENRHARMAAQLWEMADDLVEDKNNIHNIQSRRGLKIFLEEETGYPLYIAAEDIEEAIELIKGMPEGYVISILSDKPEISRFWHEKFDILYPLPDESTEGVEVTKKTGKKKHSRDRTREILYGEKSRSPIDSEAWLATPIHISNKELYDFSETVNLEALITASVRVLDELRQNLASIEEGGLGVIKDKKAVFRKCVMAESLLAPICESIGFDRLSDALNNVSIQIRLWNGGRTDLIETAREERKKLGSLEQILANARDLITTSGGKIIEEREVIQNETGYGVISREFRFIDSTGKEVRAIMRVKTIGSCAKKMLEGAYVQDLVGFTYITDEDDPATGNPGTEGRPPKDNPFEQMERVFSRVVEDATTNKDIRLMPSTPRISLGWFGGIHIKGRPALVKRMKDSIRRWLGDNVDRISTDNEVKNEDDFQVAKITALFHEVPVEIQVKTSLMRRNERVGRANHRRHKTKDNEGWEYLQAINTRRKMLPEAQMVDHESAHRRTYNLLRKVIVPCAEFVGASATSSLVDIG